MQRAANTNRFLTGYSSKLELADSEIVVSHSGLLRHIIARHLAQTAHSQEASLKLTNVLVHFAEQAYTLRDVDALEEVSRILTSLRIDGARQIGLYYRALAINRKGQRDEAEALLVKIADDGPITYRARAIQTLGANHHDKGQLDEALRFQLEALRVASDRNAHGLQTTHLARWEISIIRYLNGDHRGALSDLESISPLVNLLARQEPFYLYGYCNDLAVVLGDLGRIAEAEATLEVALASPYAPLYPNWAETRQELEAKRTSATPSVVAINRAPEAPPAPHAEPERKSKPLARLAFSRLARNKNSFQRSRVAITAAAALNLGGTTPLILYCLRKCVRTRGPPALSRGTFRPLSRNIMESAEGKASTEQNQFTLQFLCAQCYRFVAVIGVFASLSILNCSSRAPPLRRDGVPDAGLVNHLIIISNVHCFQADDRNDSHLRLVPRRQVTPRSQFASVQKIGHVGDSLRTLTARVRVRGYV